MSCLLLTVDGQKKTKKKYTQNALVRIKKDPSAFADNWVLIVELKSINKYIYTIICDSTRTWNVSTNAKKKKLNAEGWKKKESFSWKPYL